MSTDMSATIPSTWPTRADMVTTKVEADMEEDTVEEAIRTEVESLDWADCSLAFLKNFPRRVKEAGEIRGGKDVPWEQ